MAIKARPYQEKAIQAVLSDWEAGYTDVLLTMATGGGKTFVFLSVLDQVLADGKRGLVLAHRKELIEQPLDRLYQYFPRWKSGRVGQKKAGIVMADRNDPDAQLVIATVQTLSSSPKRLAQILAYGPIDYLITDEAHHAPADTYTKVYEALRKANPDLKHLGVTATPIRADGDGLAKIFQKESAHFGIVELIKNGYLAPVRWLAIQTAVSLKGVASRGGDYVAKQLKNVFETDNCFDLVVASHQKYAAGRQAVAFTVTVEGAYKLAERFRLAGISAAAADGTTDKKERARILDDFSAGRTDVLCNVGLYTEGLDVPQASCIHQVRPTKSDGLYIQMVGRALRTYPGKDDALVLDYAPMEVRNVAMMGDVLGVPLRKESYLQEQQEQGEIAGGFTFDGDYNWLEGNPAEIISRQLNYLDLSPWSWYRAEGGWMSLGLGETADAGRREVYIERTLLISPPFEGKVTLYGVWRRLEKINGPGGSEKSRPISSWSSAEICTGTFAEVSERADELCNRHGNAALAAKSRSWRKEPPSDRQIAYAKRIKGAWKQGMTKGQLAQSITHHQALQIVERQKLAEAGVSPYAYA